MKHCVLQDSSFLIATIDKSDIFHQDAVYVFKKLIENKNDLKIIVPSLVFYETIVTLTKKGITPAIIERKLWDFLYSSMILNVSLLETNAFKMCKKIIRNDISRLKTQDFIIVNVGIEYEAQILTFDKDMRKRLDNIYSEVYYCSSIGNMEDETPRFLKDLNEKLGKGEINLDDIPF